MNNISSSDSEENDPEVLSVLKIRATPNNLPLRSEDRYMKCYNNFMVWKNNNNFKSFSEKVFLAYFNELSKTLKPSTLCNTYSKLKTTLITKHNIDIKDYTKTIALLRRLSTGYKSKKSEVLSAEDVEKFINEAPDDLYLAVKVALIFGISGALSSMELVKITVDDVETLDRLLLVKLPNSSTKVERTFVVRSEFVDTVKKYEAMRPGFLKTRRYFLNYKHGKSNFQALGRHKIGGMPKKIAMYLKLPNPELYTGYCFRKTSANLFADSGSSLKRGACWKIKSNKDTKVKCDVISRNVGITNNTSHTLQLLTKPISMQQSPPGKEDVTVFQNACDGNLICESSSLKQTDSQTTEMPTGFKCKSCEDEIFGFRYVCVECAEYNICINCEALSDHPTHYMLRIPVGKSQAETRTVLERVRKELTFQQTNTDIREQCNSLAPGQIDNHKQEEVTDRSLVDVMKHEIVEHPLCSLPTYNVSSEMEQDSVPVHVSSHGLPEKDIHIVPEKKRKNKLSIKIDSVKSEAVSEVTLDIKHHEAENIVRTPPKKKYKVEIQSKKEYQYDYFNNSEQSTSIENINLTPSICRDSESKIMSLDKRWKR